jgi:CheY-like chemotaxis protein
VNRLGCAEQVKLFSSAQEVQQHLLSSGNQTFPQKIVTDLRMPLVNGFDLLKWLRANKSYDDIEVSILTTSNSHLDQAEALRLGAKNYVQKPVDLQEFQKVLSQLLDLQAGESGSSADRRL